MRANFSMSLQSLFQEIGLSNTSEASTTIMEALKKTGMDLGLPINISTESADSLASTRNIVRCGAKALTSCDSTTLYSGIKISLDNTAGTVLVPKDVVSSSISKFFNSGAAASTEFTVIDTVSNPEGKWPMGFGNVVAIEASQMGVFLEQMVQVAFSSDSFKEILMNDMYPFGALTEVVAKEIRERFLSLLRELQIESSAPIIGVQMRNRTSTYAETKQTARQSFAQFLDSIGGKIGADSPVTLMTPLLAAFEELNFLQTFLYQFFLVVVIGFTAIGCAILWTIAFSEVQELTHTSSIMGTLGLSNNILRRFHIIVSVRHSVFGIFVGAILTVAGMRIISAILSSSLGIRPREASVSAILLAALLGAVLPTIGSLLPSKHEVFSSLKPHGLSKRQGHDSLSIVVHRLQNVACNVWVILASFLMTLYGAVFYFILPRSFLEENYGLFFGILNISITGLIIGLVIILQILQESVQYVLVQVFIVLVKAFHLMRGSITLSEISLLSCVLRNMKNHRRQNRNAGLVLSFSMAILIFSGSFTELQVGGLFDSVRESLGSDIMLLAKRSSEPLNETHLRSLMANLSSENAVDKFSFITFPLSRKVQIMGAAEWPISESVNVYGLDDEFFETIFEDVTQLTEIHANPQDTSSLFQLLHSHPDSPGVQKETYAKPSCISKTLQMTARKGIPPSAERRPEIYLANTRSAHSIGGMATTPSENGFREVADEGGSSSNKIPGVTNVPIPLILSEAFRDLLSADTSTALQIKLKSLNLVAQASIMAQKLPGFVFSRFTSAASSSPILVSDYNFRRLSAILETAWELEQDTAGFEQVAKQMSSPKQRLLIRLTSNSHQSIVKDRIRMQESDAVLVRDTEDNLLEVHGLERMLEAVYAAVTIMLSFLASSMLFVVFHQNEKEVAWAINLSRAIGLTNTQVFKLQLYECCSLTIFGLSSGAVVGFLATFALALQDELFRGIRQTIRFPHVPFLVMCLACLSTSLISSLLSWKRLIDCEPAHLLRHSEY